MFKDRMCIENIMLIFILIWLRHLVDVHLCSHLHVVHLREYMRLSLTENRIEKLKPKQAVFLISHPFSIPTYRRLDNLTIVDNKSGR